MAISTTKVQTLAAYKAGNDIKKIDIFQARKSGKLYACDENGEYLFHVADDYREHKNELSVISLADSETGETWDYCCFSTPREAIDTL